MYHVILSDGIDLDIASYNTKEEAFAYIESLHQTRQYNRSQIELIEGDRIFFNVKKETKIKIEEIEGPYE